ncbi:hypothetical protein L4D11_23175 [Vibrio gigantis]|uniref:hypothetical protein n=1 Tax=Vibrio gigantis TaxID=296199 RepID=UPI003D0A042F
MENYKIVKIVKGYRPLAYVEDFIILSRGYKIYRSDLNLNNIELICQIPSDSRKKVFSKNRLFSRIFRLGVNFCLNIEDDSMLLVCRDHIWRVNYRTGSVTLDFKIPKKRTALYLTLLPQECGKNKIIFGEYFNNQDKLPVNIWERDLYGDWTISYTFSTGEINHVHNIIPCNTGNIVLTGDFGKSAAIYRQDGETLHRLLYGDQKYRACWAMESNDRLYYATDSQLKVNHITSMSLGGNTNDVEVGKEIEGSSIYYTKIMSGVVFSSTVEPGELHRSRIRNLLSCDKGYGIKSFNSKIYKLDINGDLMELFSAKKDIIPPRIGQFGTFTFPSGMNPNRDDFICYGQAVKSFDGKCLLFRKV